MASASARINALSSEKSSPAPAAHNNARVVGGRWAVRACTTAAMCCHCRAKAPCRRVEEAGSAAMCAENTKHTAAKEAP